LHRLFGGCGRSQHFRVLAHSGCMAMHAHTDARAEAALYWSAVSLIVCEGLSIDKAAERLGVEHERLRTILHRRQIVGRASDEAPHAPHGRVVRLRPR
jgi:hypothetical protein